MTKLPAISICLAVSLGCAFNAPSRVESSSTDLQGPLDLAEFRIEVGSLTIVGSDTEQTVLDKEIHWADDGRPQVSEEIDDGILQVVSECPSGTATTSCRVDFVVALPSDTEVSIELGDGALEVEGILGAVTATVGLGDAKLSAIGGGVHLVNSYGDAVLSRVTGDLYLDVASGVVLSSGLRSNDVLVSTTWGRQELDFTQLGGTLSTTSKEGGIQITLPDGTYDVAALSDFGQVDVSVEQDPDAEGKVVAASVSGDVEVSYGVEEDTQ